MAQLAPKPGTGIDGATGAIIDGFAHVLQSLQVIFTTRFGERVMRRWFGSFVPQLLGRNLTNSTVLRFWTAVCAAIDLWEPRFRIVKITAAGTPDELRSGKIAFILAGVYFPRGHLGDFSVRVPKQVILGPRRPATGSAPGQGIGATEAAGLLDLTSPNEPPIIAVL